MTPEAIPVASVVSPPTIPSQELRSEVKQFSSQASRLANQIIGEQAQEKYTGPVVIRRHYYYSYSPWYYPQPSVIVVGDRGSFRRDRREEKEANMVAFGIIATIGAMFASYAVGLAVSRHQDAQRELAETREFQGKMAEAQGHVTPQDQQLVNDAQEAAGLKARICKRIRDSAATDLALRISLTVGLVFAALGAFGLCPPLLGVGLLAAAVAGFVMMFKWGMDTTDQANARDAYALQLKLLALPA